MKIYFLVVLSVLCIPAMACDSCSSTFCAVGSQTFQTEKNYIGIVWSYFSQQSKYSLFDKPIKKKTKINQLGLSAAFSFKKKYQISILVPSYFSVINNKSSFALGDPIVNFRYKIYEKKPMLMHAAKHTLYGIFGLKLPLGAYVNTSLNQLENISFSTKTVDFLLGVQYVYVKRNKGINLSFNTRLNTSDKSKRRIGHAFILKSLFFANKDIKKSKLGLFTGLSAEYNMRNVINGYTRPYTGGMALYLSLGSSLRLNNIISIMLNTEVPLAQQYRIQNGTIFTNLRINFNTKILF